MAMLNNQRVSLSLCVAVWPCPSGESLEVGDLANCSSFCSFVALDVETPLRDVLHLIAGRHRKKRQGQVGITGKNMDQILFNVESLLFPWFSWLMKRLIQLLETNLHVCSFWRWNGETVKPTFFVGKIHVVLLVLWVKSPEIMFFAGWKPMLVCGRNPHVCPSLYARHPHFSGWNSMLTRLVDVFTRMSHWEYDFDTS